MTVLVKCILSSQKVFVYGYKETFEEYGFYNVETPILCYYDILSDKYDEENDEIIRDCEDE